MQRNPIPSLSHVALLRSHMQILELMASHCDRLLQQGSGSAFHKIELRRAANAYRGLVEKHRRFLELVEPSLKDMARTTAA